MRLSTLQCVALGCQNEFHEDRAMWFIEEHAKDLGWVVLDDEHTFCPEHAVNEDGEQKQMWVVGCFTCDFEEEFDSEEDARYELRNHECEADTYIHSPDELKEKALRRKAYQEHRDVQQLHEKEQARAAADANRLRQRHIEKHARNWLRIRNTVVFWRKEHL